MKKNELIEGQYYRVQSYVMKAKGTNTSCYYFTGTSFATSGNFHGYDFEYTLATPEEIHQLNECIKVNKFISKEEAMKTLKKELPIFN